MSPQPDRPRLTAKRESIVPAESPTPPPTGTDSEPTTPTGKPASFTLSLRVPVSLADRVQYEIRRLHFEKRCPKGVIAEALLEEALSHMAEIEERLSAR